MSEALEFLERPNVEETVMLIGWKQWADAGAISSALPNYLIKLINARRIGQIRPDGFYLFQVPGTHDLVRPTIRFKDGYPEELSVPQNDFYYGEVDGQGVVIFLGVEPHMDAERYITLLLDAAQQLHVTRMVGFGGVYAELPYNKERTVSGSYSLPHLKSAMQQLSVTFTDYHGGASIGSYLCRRAGEKALEYIGLYAFVPTYDFSELAHIGNTLRLEQDHMAWYAVMRRVNYLLKTNFDLADLAERSKTLIRLLDAKVDQLDDLTPDSGVRNYFQQLEESFTEVPFDPLDDVWENELRRLLKDDDND